MQEIDSLKKSHTALQGLHTALKGEVHQQNDRIRVLEKSVKKGQTIRTRFILMFKRGGLQMSLSPHVSKIVREGNAIAHDGNILFDADLYEGEEARRDRLVFESLYGLDPGAVKKYQ